MTRFEALKAAHERKIAQNPTTIRVDRTQEEIVVRLVPGGRIKQQMETAAGLYERLSWTVLFPAGADVVRGTSQKPETFVTAAGQEFEVWEVRSLAVDGQEWGKHVECVEMT